MNKELLEQFKEELIKKKQDLEAELKTFATRGDDERWEVNYPSIESKGIEEEANEVEEYDSLLSIEQSLSQNLKNINLALEKIEKGTYGICENCKKEMPLERLRAFPEARTCSCKN